MALLLTNTLSLSALAVGKSLPRIETLEATQTTVYVDPSDNWEPVGQTFTINVCISDVVGLYGYEFQLFYDTTILDGIKVEAPLDHFLKPSDPTGILVVKMKVNDNYNASLGQVWVAMSLLSPELPKNGDGTLATITFRVTGEGESILDLETKLGNEWAEPIPHTAIGAKFVTRVGQPHSTAEFSWEPSKPHLNETVTFNASKSRGAWNGTDYLPIIRNTWNFGDGTSSIIETTPVINHTFMVAGEFIITLNVTDIQGHWGTTSESTAISGPSGPTALFTYARPCPFENATVTFDASASTLGWDEKQAGFAPIVKYEWNFGDSTLKVVVTDPVAFHVFTEIGRYTITLNVTDSRGWWQVTSHTITVISLLEGQAIVITPPFYYAKMTDDILTVEIFIQNVADLYGFEFKLGYDTAILDGIDARPGSFLHEPIFVAKSEINEAGGYVWLAASSLAPAPVASGSGLLATITFKVTGRGLCIFSLFGIKLGSPYAAPLPEVPVITLPIHNVAIVAAVPSNLEVYPGQIINITTTALNDGNEHETFNVTVYGGTHILGTQTVNDLAPSSRVNITFSWNTRDTGPCYNITIRAEASAVANEVEMTDNVYFGGTVKIKMLGDVNGDKIIDISDVIAWAETFGITRESPVWNPQTDLYMDGVIDIFDGVTIALNFGKIYT